MRVLAMTPLSDLADVEMAQLVAVSARLPVERRAAFVRRVEAALAAGKSFLGAMAAAQRAISAPRQSPESRGRYRFMTLALETVPRANVRPASRGWPAAVVCTKAAAGRRLQAEFQTRGIGSKVEPQTHPESHCCLS
jgi:hypothetical protein